MGVVDCTGGSAARLARSCWLCSRHVGCAQLRASSGAQAAHAAEARGDDATAGEAWRRYRLIRDTRRDPDELLAEGIALSKMAMALAAIDHPRV